MFKVQNDSNYLAKIVQISDCKKHPEADRLLIWNINNYEVITDLGYNDGDVCVFFPIECQINNDLLSNLNMFEKSDMNVDKVKGYVHKSGRIRAVKLRGVISEGVIIKFDKFANWLSGRGYTAVPEIGTTFDYFDKLMICQKYTIPVKSDIKMVGGKTPKVNDLLIEGQFAFHGKTEKLQDNLHKLLPTDIIYISAKIHGTSAVYSNVLINRKLSLIEKLASQVFKIVKQEYSKMYSSRTVLKYVEKVYKKDDGFYNTDFWGAVYKDIKDSIEEGYSLYGEIVGQINGSFVQKGYDYSKLLNNTYGFFVYKITYTSPNGQVIELSYQQMKEYCVKHNLNLVPLVYFGTAANYCAYYQDSLEEWQKTFIGKIRNEIERNCEYCNNNVPYEGYVVRIEHSRPLRLKIKSKVFLSYETKQLDSGEASIEEAN